MKTALRPTLLLAGALWLLPSASAAHHKKCPGDSVRAGDVCMDVYEASIWKVPDPTGANKSLVKKIHDGTIVHPSELTEKGAIQLGVAPDDYGACSENGAGCTDVFAVSLAGVAPSANANWFQAQQACAMAGKHLPTSAEWQQAADGTPDPGPDNGTTDCNTASGLLTVATGSRSACVSNAGAFDMVGNLWEWTADWAPSSTSIPGWGAISNDVMGLSGASEVAQGPGALLRGSCFNTGSVAGPLALITYRPQQGEITIGFRCARH